MNGLGTNSQAGWLNIEQELVLLLTATINVKGMPNAYPTVPEQRQEDYYNSLKYYINFHPRIKKILFVENSGWPLERLQETTQENPHNKQIEFRLFGLCYGMDWGYRGWNPYVEKHLAIFVNCFSSKANSSIKSFAR